MIAEVALYGLRHVVGCSWFSVFVMKLHNWSAECWSVLIGHCSFKVNRQEHLTHSLKKTFSLRPLTTWVPPRSHLVVHNLNWDQAISSQASHSKAIAGGIRTKWDVVNAPLGPSGTPKHKRTPTSRKTITSPHSRQCVTSQGRITIDHVCTDGT